MCGIVGIASNDDCVEGLVSGLKSLEYRGYDSSGLVCNVQNQFHFKKSLGKISNLKKTLKKIIFREILVLLIRDGQPTENLQLIMLILL